MEEGYESVWSHRYSQNTHSYRNDFAPVIATSLAGDMSVDIFCPLVSR
jgi:hypothetical protein